MNDITHHNSMSERAERTWLKPAPVGECDPSWGPLLAHPLVLSCVLDVLKADPEVMSIIAYVFSKETVNKGLLKPGGTVQNESSFNSLGCKIRNRGL